MPGNCDRCGEAAVYQRRYSGETLCAACFQASIVDKTRRSINKYRLFRPRERIGVAVSGGKDSLSLLDVLARIVPAANLALHVLSIDEGIAGYRDEGLTAARAACHRLGVPQTVLSYGELFGMSLDTALARRQGWNRSACAICGPWRRRAIDLAAMRAQVDVIATAHNLDDFLQTFYLNLLTGDVDRLEWLDPLREDRPASVPRRVKPFVEIYEEELALYAYLREFPFQEVPCPHAHEGVRSQVRVFLNALERDSPGIKYTALGAAMRLTRQTEASRTRASQPCTRCGLPATGPICHACGTARLLQLNTHI
jgi:uncharacterized protein (TIGR00269 family)